jgi:hypothetical protein
MDLDSVTATGYHVQSLVGHLILETRKVSRLDSIPEIGTMSRLNSIREIEEMSGLDLIPVIPKLSMLE